MINGVAALLTFICCYLLGSILWGLIVAGAVYRTDIRSMGSGNVGFTNVKRVLGWKPAIVVLILDALKGVGAVWISRRVFEGRAGEWQDALILAGGVMAIIGHNWSVFHNFAGGKGVATSLGVLFALDWRVGILALAVGFPLLVFPGYMSVASTVGTISVPIWFTILGAAPWYRLFGVVVSVFVVVRHRANWIRLAKGTEPKFSFRSGASGAEQQAERVASHTGDGPGAAGAEPPTAEQ